MLVTPPALVISTPVLRYLQLGTPHAVKHVTPTTTGVLYPSIPSHPTQHARGIAHPTSSYQVHFTPLYTYNYKVQLTAQYNTILYKQPPVTGSHGHPRKPHEKPTEHPRGIHPPKIPSSQSRGHACLKETMRLTRHVTVHSTVQYVRFQERTPPGRRSAVMHPPSLRGG